ncbi:MAG: hypothetical protein ACLPN2_00170, partial [Terriglobales bacterium]
GADSAGPVFTLKSQSFNLILITVMNERRWVTLIVSSVLALAPLFAAGAQTSPGDQRSTLKTVKLKTAKVAGKWRIAWDVRFGTVRATLLLKQNSDQVTGTFEEYGKTYPLTGSLQGEAITFDVPFAGPRPYTIEFKGTVDRAKKMTGTSELKGGGHVFLGHANEIQEPDRPWTALKGSKWPAGQGKPPIDDDD